MMFDPLSMPGWLGEPPPRDLDNAWRAVAAALRPVAAAVAEVAAHELNQPSWRPGERVEDAAYAEGRKAVWRAILTQMENGR